MEFKISEDQYFTAAPLLATRAALSDSGNQRNPRVRRLSSRCGMPPILTLLVALTVFTGPFAVDLSS
jgi:hypothetical protein